MEGAVDGKSSLGDHLKFQEFKNFGKLEESFPRAMSQGQCSSSKTCEKMSPEPQDNRLAKSDVSDSKTSISACSCGPECGPDKCDGRNRSVLVGWDSLRTKIFIVLFVGFVIWLVVYVPVSLTILGN